jgi:hypothetical protein
MDKAKGLNTAEPLVCREVSVAVKWFEGLTALEGAPRVDDDGTYLDASGRRAPADPDYIDADGHYILPGERYISYYGNGSYCMCRRSHTSQKTAPVTTTALENNQACGGGGIGLQVAHDSGADTYLYERNIVLDDLPHYLKRHDSVRACLERISIFSVDTDARFELVRKGSNWSARVGNEGDAALAQYRRRLRASPPKDDSSLG